MLKVEQYEFIRSGYRVYGLTISELSRRTGHSRNTIRKLLNNEYTGYSARSHQPFPALEPYIDIINSWLEQDKEQHRKQKHTARRIYTRLVREYGFDGAESTVRRYVRLVRGKHGKDLNKAYIPADPDVGLEAEVDWGDFTAIIGGKTRQLKLFCMRSKYSGKCFVRAYPVERQQALFDGHIHAFVFFNGVFFRLIYDNMTPAVQKVLQGKKRVEQESFARFRAYYTFEAEFCNRGQGHEKGGVEGLVGFARRNFLVPVPRVDTLEELNRHLLEECMAYGSHIISGRQNTVNERFEQEKDHLIDLPQVPYANEMPLGGKVDHYSTVVLDKNRYSVPTHYAGFRVRALLGVDTVTIYHSGRKIAEHSREYGNNKWVLKPDHYLELLHKRPAAFATAKPIKQWRSCWPRNHERLLERFKSAQGISKGTRDFIEVLMLYREYEPVEVEAAVEQALASGVSSAEAVKHLVRAPATEPEPGRLQSWPSLPQADISVYSRLGGVA
ncbi:MAG: IS21 family transposase [Desulfobacterales bacterium]|nr:IS21 family transposase [Desulfobacterales bacterium]